MAEITLTATTGRTTGTRSSRRLRAEAKVPAVVYGLGREPVAVTVDWRELRAALITDAGVNALIDLSIEGEGESQLAIVKDMQRHAIRRTVEHVDFLLIRRDQEITVDVPLVAEGEAKAVEDERGMIETLMSSLAINAKPGSIPDQLTYDVSAMTIGDTITVGDLSLPAGVTTDVDPEDAIASAQISRAAIEAEAIEAADAEMAAEQAEESSDGGASEDGGESGGDPAAGEGEPSGDEG
ncbi:50S ribosomal protein L25 [Iamia sp. SCSIO 61187]|uniref:50S ribosomal protein L25 n=1 Tax=Iamia sp. SCSIO 61187 TaxID=2722752 RepID=UPI001C62A2C9|nr:50S ribosomal protein L25 [Iamia sp. SCSIO 61187]QYG92108.1 50S ribosomal protein L25 [Iamia sp. SCSIO 61187]